MRFLASIVIPVVALAAGTGAVVAAWTPELVGGSVSGGFESRPIEGLESDIDPSTGSGDGRYWYAPPEDWGGTFEVWSRWKIRSSLGKSKVKLSYARNDWVDGEIFARNILGFTLVHDLGGGYELDLDAEYVPEVYKRHRADKDAGPGEPRFRPETYSDLDVELAFARDWGHFSTSIIGLVERRNENEWFDERDRLGLGVGAGLDFAVWEGSRFRPFYLRSSTESRNEPDLGSDLSFDEDSYGLRFTQEFRDFRTELYGKIDVRSYTTTDPEDDSRYGREDTGKFFSGKLAWRPGALQPFLSYEKSRSSSQLPGVVAEEQDDGEDERSLVRLGVDFQWSLD
ncbi:MAG: hypothetical protein R3E97_03710 [Candidatus Eisenbacteria bacterium]